MFGEKEDEKILKREILRLELSITEGIKKFGEDKEIIICMHYPPVNKQLLDTCFLRVMQKYNVKICIYGHLHGEALTDAVEGIIGGIELKLVSADYLDFKLLKIA